MDLRPSFLKPKDRMLAMICVLFLTFKPKSVRAKTHKVYKTFALSLNGNTYGTKYNYIILRTRVGCLERERANETITNFVQTVKFNPEGTCGPIWPEVVPLFRSCSWPHCGAKKIVKM